MATWFPNIDWTAVSAISQILGVIATFSAVIIALRINKPKIKIRAIWGLEFPSKKFAFAINVLNLSKINVRITSTGFSMRKKIKTIRRTDMNKWLAVHDEITDSYNLTELKKLFADELAKNHIRQNDKITVYAADSAGKYHYYKTNHIVKNIFEINE